MDTTNVHATSDTNGLTGRQQRGQAIAAAGGAAIVDGSWRVASQSNAGKRYRVNPLAQSCTCPDHEETNLACKHVYAVLVVMTTEKAADGTTTAIATKTTYSQDWSSYNRAQVEEKDTFMRLLADLCSGIPQPPQSTGRPRLPMSDMVFATTYKVFSRFSSRRFASDLRAAHEAGLISRVPHFNSVSNYLSSEDLTPVLQELITESSLPLRALETDFAVDSSGFSSCRFEKWLDAKHGTVREAKTREWLKAHLMVGVKTNIVTSVEMSRWNESDTRYFAPLVRATAQNFDMAEVSADKAYLAKKNLALVEDRGAVPYVPFKSNTRPVIKSNNAWDRMYHRFMADRETFMASYHKRSNVETTFAMIKGKFGDAVLSKSPVGQANEVLCKVLAHNIVVVGQAAIEFGIDPTFGACETHDAPSAT